MNPADFDALVFTNQGFNTLNSVANSNVAQDMTNQTLHSIQAMQTPVPQGHLPQHAVLPMFQNQAANQQNVPTPPQQFFAVVNGAQKGPFSLEQLKGLAIADVLNEDSMVWMQGMPEWVPLKICLSNLK